ncbi:MAG TPA: TonB-dependent receptor [Acidobacteriota bacterium]|nr:TonB-dependent receptor [Acidobacteriota bacterium]
MRRKLTQLLSALLFLAVVLSPTGFSQPVLAYAGPAVAGGAQEVSGSIKGVVRDQTGAVVAGATVTAKNAQRTYEATTDASGNYTFANLQPGTYTISATASGFTTYEVSDLSLELGRTLQVNMDLKAGGQDEIVNVTAADAAYVDVTSSKTAVNINEMQIRVLPKTLNFSSVLEVAPGTRSEGKSGGFQIDGASGVENVFVVDGVEVTEITQGRLRSSKNTPLDFVKEVQVKSAGYEAEYGGATGGVVNVVTKSGTNEFHGEGRFEYTSDSFRAEDNPTQRLNPLDPRQQTVEYFANPRGKDNTRLINPNFTIGGPVIKDRLWFFLGYAPQYEVQTRRLDLIKPVAAGDTAIQTLNTRLVDYRTKRDYLITRLDFAPSSKINVYGSFQNNPIKTEGPPNLLAFQTTSNSVFLNPRYPFQGGYTPAWQLSGGVTWSITPNLILSARTGHNYFNDKGGAYDILPNTPLVIINAPCTAPECAGDTRVTGRPVVETNSLTQFDITRRTNFYGDATWVKSIGGQQHIIKGGYQINRLSNKVEFGFSGGRFQYFFGRTFAGEKGKYGYYIADDFARSGDVNSSNQGIFVQDTWQLNKNLTLNLGVRFEKEFLPSFPIRTDFHPDIPADVAQGTGTRPIDFGWGDKIAPRIGAAWDVLGDGKIKVSGSFSIFYDTMKYELPRGSFGGEKFLRTYRKLEQADYRGINLTNQPGDVILGPIDLRFPSNVTLPGSRPTIDPDLKPFKMREFSFAVDYNFSKDWLFSARFTRKDVLRAIEDVGGLDSQGNEVYTIGNPGFGATVDFFDPPTPKAVREYTGLELRLDKRFSKNWYANFSYIYSKLYGNYSGLASSDEITNGVGRTSPNVNRNFDLPALNFDANGDILLGRLPTDRPHTFKTFAAYRFDYKGFGKNMSTEIGGSQFIYQGTPITTTVNSTVEGSSGLPLFPFGRGDAGRTEVFTQTDLVVSHFINVSERVRFKFSFNVFNLFDERNQTDLFNGILGPGQNVNFATLAEYLSSTPDGVKQRISSQNLVLDPRYKQAVGFQNPREARISFGIQF